MLVIVGSTDLWVTPEIVSIVLGKVAATDAIDTLGVRVPRGSDEPSTMLEKFVAQIGPDLGRVVTRCRASTNKRGDVYRRDYEMVQNARNVLAFFAPDQEMEGGTGHVVQAALARGVPVEAYRLNETGSPELLGSDDGFLRGAHGNDLTVYIDGHPVPVGPFTVTWTTNGISTTSGTTLANINFP